MDNKPYVWQGEPKFSDLCMLFPEMNDEDFDRLKCHINDHGLQDLVITYKGKIVDGRHRALACEELGVPIDCEEWDGDPDDLLDYVLGENLARRHMTQSQLAMIGAEVEKMIAENILQSSVVKVDNDPKSGKNARDAHSEAAKQVGVSRTYVVAAKAIADKSPEIAKKVKDGELSITEGKKALGIGHGSKNGNGALDEIPKKFLPLLADLPSGAKVAAWRKAVAAAPDGCPTEGQVRKAAGVVIVECDEPETVDDIIEEREEEQAIEDESTTEEEWLAQLPLTGRMAAACQRTYYAEALAWRHLGKAMAAWGRSVAAQLGRMKLTRGPFMYRVQLGLKVDPPEKWVLCPDPVDGGCAGRGRIKTGEGPEKLDLKCPKCHGAGYRVNS